MHPERGRCRGSDRPFAGTRQLAVEVGQRVRRALDPDGVGLPVTRTGLDDGRRRRGSASSAGRISPGGAELRRAAPRRPCDADDHRRRPHAVEHVDAVGWSPLKRRQQQSWKPRRRSASTRESDAGQARPPARARLRGGSVSTPRGPSRRRCGRSGGWPCGPEAPRTPRGDDDRSTAKAAQPRGATGRTRRLKAQAGRADGADRASAGRPSSWPSAAQLRARASRHSAPSQLFAERGSTRERRDLTGPAPHAEGGRGLVLRAGRGSSGTRSRRGGPSERRSTAPSSCSCRLARARAASGDGTASPGRPRRPRAATSRSRRAGRAAAVVAPRWRRSAAATGRNGGSAAEAAERAVGLDETVLGGLPRRRRRLPPARTAVRKAIPWCVRTIVSQAREVAAPRPLDELRFVQWPVHHRRYYTAETRLGFRAMLARVARYEVRVRNGSTTAVTAFGDAAKRGRGA